MRKLFYVPALTFFLTALISCSTGSNGELIGIKQKSWFEPNPYGMQLIPTGSFIMGPNDQDAKAAFNSQNLQVSVDAFWMDETEITNSEYKQFLSWTRDSLTRLFIFKNSVGPDADKFSLQNKAGDKIWLDEPNNVPRINFKTKIDKRDPDIKTVLDTLFNYRYNPTMGYQLKNSSYIYTYNWIDYRQAALKVNQINPLTNRYDRQKKANGAISDSADFMIRKDISVFKDDGSFDNITLFQPLTNRNDFSMQRTVNVYPDTLCWMRDFTYAHNEPYMKQYLAHPGYGDYPLVGVTWDQATAFCNWRTKMKNDFLVNNGEPMVQDYRLPKESEWEYAARGGSNSAMYPWGGPYTRKADGCYLANFKPQRGNHPADGFLVTGKIGSYPPNDFGLYDMAGNVAEWTASTYSESSMSFVNDLQPDYQINARVTDPAIMKRKVVRGGSWKDVAYYLQCGVSTYEYQDESRCFIGFRCTRSFIGPE